MKTWLDTYTQLVTRTKWLSVVGIVLVLLLLSWEAVELAGFLRNAGPFNSEQLSLIFWEFACLVPLFGALIWRIFVVGSRRSHGYGRQFFSFVVSMFAFGAFLVFDVYNSFPVCIPAKDGNCYAFYDATTRPSYARLAAIAYILVSGMRFLVTASIAFVKVRYGLK